jgi:hypothetical protein
MSSGTRENASSQSIGDQTKVRLKAAAQLLFLRIRECNEDSSLVRVLQLPSAGAFNQSPSAAQPSLGRPPNLQNP